MPDVYFRYKLRRQSAMSVLPARNLIRIFSEPKQFKKVRVRYRRVLIKANGTLTRTLLRGAVDAKS
jgi:hypothetical protein